MNTGGPAFPQPNHIVDTDRGREEARGWMQDSGMSLRDWFAGQALMGWAAGRNKTDTMDDSNPSAVALSCYRYADAMIAVGKATE
jgi:hypothetical protein